MAVTDFIFPVGCCNLNALFTSDDAHDDDGDHDGDDAHDGDARDDGGDHDDGRDVRGDDDVFLPSLVQQEHTGERQPRT
ncbi:hypothetical protein TNIN_113421 [Trichonephila inaurata madagascariensis]|uniref:Uncharacterized protein n=1 Tax=Trichonephila inaurata madagascariensis TaxID=2747483 RepID=A0A8X6IND5_9ARAC|nr:hypothetical protein TNIN_113421 [Trichonephila inaurata madagascariensis]